MVKQDKIKKQDLTSDLKKLSQIVEWFEEREEVDLEEGLKRVKEAAELIKRSKERLREIENEFEEIKKEITEEIEEEEEPEDVERDNDDEEELDTENIPF